MIDIDHIYVIHYKPLVERKQYLTNKFSELNITNYTFYEEYSRDTTSEETMDKYYKYKSLHLNSVQKCITIAHIEVYKDIVKKQYKRCLILEDDAILAYDFANRLRLYNERLPYDFDIGSLNDGCGLHAQNINPSVIWYYVQSLRTCCAYIISNDCCIKLLKTIIPFSEAIDWELNVQIQKHDLRVYWAEPTIVSDGSVFIYHPSYVNTSNNTGTPWAHG
jgi:GR25 family glycosyltransferase involved in LPS biosynthesis